VEPACTYHANRALQIQFTMPWSAAQEALHHSIPMPGQHRTLHLVIDDGWASRINADITGATKRNVITVMDTDS
jgi:hypothetical protein